MYQKVFPSLWYLLSLTFFVSVSFCFARATNPAPTPSTGFLQNQGQWPDKDLYRVKASGFSIAFMEDGLRFLSSREIESDEEDSNSMADSDLVEVYDSEHEKLEYYVWTMRFKNCQESIKLQSKQVVARRTNFFLGNDPDKWVRQAPEFADLYYEEVWPGIDVHFYLMASGELKYDFILSPEADLSAIGIVYDGLEGLSVRVDGLLELHHPWHPVLEAAPKSWKLKDQTPVEVQYRKTGLYSYGFEVKGEVPSGETWVIDPVLQVWSTFTRTTGLYDYAYNVTHDPQGRLYMTGTTAATFPSTVGTYQPVHGGGGNDAYIARFSSNGSLLDYMTYFGGSGDDGALDIEYSNGRVYFCGYSRSQNLPITNSLGSFISANYFQAFVSCLSSNGSNLIYSSFLCNGCPGRANALEIVSNGDIIVAGTEDILSSPTPSFPTTAGAHSNIHQGQNMGWVCRLNSVGNAIIWSTMIGGNNRDIVFDLAVNALEEPYIVGYTRSTNFPLSTGAIYSSLSGFPNTGFITHFNATGTALIGGTYMGLEMFAIYVDQASGDAYVGGEAIGTAGAFTPTPGAWQTTFSANRDAILVRVDPTMTNMRFGTIIGETVYEPVHDIAVNQAGEIYVSGATWSSNFPISSCQLQSAHEGFFDVYLVHLNPDASDLAQGGSALFGGVSGDYKYFKISLRESSVGDTLFSVLTTHSPDFPVTPGAHQTTKLNGFQDTPAAMKLFVPRWELGKILCQGDSVQVFSPAASSNTLWSTNDTSSSIWINQSGTYWVAFDYHGCTRVDTFEVLEDTTSIYLGEDTSFCAGSVSPVTLTAASGTDWLWSTGQTTSSISTTGPGIYWVQASDSITGCSVTDTLAILEDPLPQISLSPGSFCEGDSILLVADPGNLYPGASYLWSNTDTNPQTFFSLDGQVWVELTDSNGCTSQALTTLNEIPEPQVDLGPDMDLCEGDSAILVAGTMGSGLEFLWNTGDAGETLMIDQAGTYSVSVLDPQNGCTNSDSILIDFLQAPVPILPEDTLVCDTDIFILDPGPATFGTYIWSDGSALSQLQVSQPGEYAVTVTNSICMDSARSRVDFGRRPEVDLGPDLEICRGDQLLLNVTELLDGTVIWNDGGDGWSRLIARAGTYWVMATNECGMASDTVEIELGQQEEEIFIPNVFSPNNDGINDCFKTDGRISDSFQLLIYDRWGKLVFETKDMNECWEGDFDGRPLPEGVYYGTVKLSGCLGKQITAIKAITLVR